MTLKVYFDKSKKNYQVIKPGSEDFYKHGCSWSQLALALYPNYHSFEVY